MKKEFTDKAEAEKFFNELRAEKKWEIDAYILPEDKGYSIQWIESKTYIAHDGKEYPDETWLTEAGDLVLIQDLTADHAKNIIRMMLRKDREARAMISTLLSMDGDLDDEDMSCSVPVTPHTIH
jgi:hypothetical protein